MTDKSEAQRTIAVRIFTRGGVQGAPLRLRTPDELQAAIKLILRRYNAKEVMARRAAS